MSRDLCAEGLGNERDNVGRYFMAHLHFLSGVLVASRTRRRLGLYDVPLDQDENNWTTLRFAGLQISELAQRENQILNGAGFLMPFAAVLRAEWPTAFDHARRHLALSARLEQTAWRVVRRIARPFFQLPMELTEQRLGHRLFVLRNWLEQAPARENRISLSDECDEIGMPKLRMDWTIGELEKRTATTFHKLLAHEFEAVGLGRFHSNLPTADEPWTKDFALASHFMGSTRMSLSPESGVVNRDCQVHTVPNLFIAGGSVMPTSGACMVTYNLLALTLRLADHLKQEFARDAL